MSSHEEERYGTFVEHNNVKQPIIKAVTKLLWRIREKAQTRIKKRLAASLALSQKD
jgi:hypothetical protein